MLVEMQSAPHWDPWGLRGVRGGGGQSYSISKGRKRPKYICKTEKETTRKNARQEDNEVTTTTALNVALERDLYFDVCSTARVVDRRPSIGNALSGVTYAQSVMSVKLSTVRGTANGFQPGVYVVL